MPRIADQLVDDGLVVHLAATARTCTAPDSKCCGRSQQVLDLARRQAGGAHARRVERQHRVRRDARRRPGDERGEAVPHGLRRLDRDLLADDRARQRGEGVAAALQAAVAELRDQLASSRGRACARCLQASSQYSGVTSGRRAWQRSLKLRPSPRWCPAAVSFSTMPCASSSSRMRSARGEVARLLGRGARLDARGDVGLVERRCRACRNARGACCRTPSVRAQRLQQRRRLGRRACGSPRRPARTAPPPRPAC